MSQELTLEDKRKFLPVMGVQTMLEGGVPNGLDALAGGFAGCCGSIYVNEEAKMGDYFKDFDKRVWWQRGKDIPSPLNKGDQFLLVPDMLGNVLVQWEEV